MLNHKIAFLVSQLWKFVTWNRNVCACYITLNLIITYWKALPEHGVYTVFVNLGNTKIEVSNNEMDSFQVILLSMPCDTLLFEIIIII